MHTKDSYKFSAVTEKIISGCYTVYNNLGSGFLEKVYENALVLELENHNLRVGQQVPISVHYAGKQVGEYFADLLVENLIIVELKAIDTLADIHEVQLVNYLKATRLEVGLLVNFGPKIQIKRKINTVKNNSKGIQR